jgi:DNA-binding NtrC family response regulator
MSKESTIIIVYSEFPGERDYLRNQVIVCGLNAICFESENTCIDNLKTIKPKMVIVQTESAACVWRFLFSIHLAGLRSPLIVLSEWMKGRRFNGFVHTVPVHMVKHHHKGGRFSRMMAELAAQPTAGEGADNLPLFVGESEATRHIRSGLPNIALSHDSVLIVGERGTGKELLSRIIEEASGSDKRLVRIDCSALEPWVLANGAMQDVLNQEYPNGLIVVHFDKIHLIPLGLQSDLLLLVEEARKFRSGNGNGARGGIRFIATSEQKIETLVQQGSFRKDLYYRLNVIPILLPPLRHRKADISLLMDYFIIDACIRNNKSIVIPSQKVREISFVYEWPGNADELNSYMNRVVIEGDESCILNNPNISKAVKRSGKHLLSVASMEELPKAHEIKDFIPTAENLSLRSICDEFVSRTERRLMKRALESTNWNRKKAAQLLSISYKSMLNKMKTYDII